MNSSGEESRFHRIRLHGPWQAEVVQCDTENLVGKKQKLSVASDWVDWLGAGFRGTVSLIRRFGCPTGLHQDQRVWLVVEQVDFHGCVWLNELSLGELNPAGVLRIEVGQRLHTRNVLRIDLFLTNANTPFGRTQLTGDLIGSVRLEIEE